MPSLRTSVRGTSPRSGDPGGGLGYAEIIAKQDLVLAGILVARESFRKLDPWVSSLCSPTMGAGAVRVHHRQVQGKRGRFWRVSVSP